MAADKDNASTMYSNGGNEERQAPHVSRFANMFADRYEDGMDHHELEVTQQVFPSAEAGKKVVVFRTNFARLGVDRATVHFSPDDVYGCDRGQCDRFHYMFDAGEMTTIPVYISKNGRDVPDELMYVEVDL